ncbi:MAG: FkbM family methyltransferase [Planctomycetota bacterium]|jgi:FkbM family methyltransferase
MLDRIKQAVKGVPWLHRLLRGRAIRAQQQLEAAHHAALARFREAVAAVPGTVEQPVFVKVGAHDGVSGDPVSDLLLADQRWAGLLVEPVPYCVERLRTNFNDAARFTIVEAAVGAAPGRAPFYYVDHAAKDSLPDLPDWYDQLGAMERGHIAAQLDGALEPFIREREVEVVTLAQLLERHDLDHIDLLHIDAEGHDFEVLKTLDLDARPPRLILLEQKHLGAADRAALESLLQGHGYSLSDCGWDLAAVRNAAQAR